VWERWDGVDADGVPSESLNHYSKGAVITFLHRYVAGIRLPDGAPGYRQFRIEPQPGGGITWAQARHDSPYGRVESAWRRDVRAVAHRPAGHDGRSRAARRFPAPGSPRPAHPALPGATAVAKSQAVLETVSVAPAGAGPAGVTAPALAAALSSCRRCLDGSRTMASTTPSPNRPADTAKATV
jgi:hypothetical protein